MNNYTPGRDFSIASYAPTTAGNPTVLNNNINLSNVTATVNGPNAHSSDITGKFQVANMPFASLYRVSGIIGLSGQIGRPTTIEASIRKTDPNNQSTNAHIVHGLSIITTAGSIANVASTFQDITAMLPVQDCFAYMPSGGSYLVSPYCDRGIPA